MAQEYIGVGLHKAFCHVFLHCSDQRFTSIGALRTIPEPSWIVTS